MFRHPIVFFIGTILFGVLSWTRISAAHIPMYGRWGFDEQGEDTQTKPGDDFFQFANGAWIDKTPIPSDKDGESLRRQAAARTAEQLHELIETAALRADHEPMTLPGKVGAYYKAFVDERRIDRLGISAISQELAAVKRARTHSAIAKLMGHTKDDFEGAIYGIAIDVDLKNQSRYAVYLSQAGLGLPDRDYYLNSEYAGKRGPRFDRKQQIHRVLIALLTVGKEPLSDWEPNQTGHGAVRWVPRGSVSEARDQTPREFSSTGADKGHHGVQVVECIPRIVDVRIPERSEPLPPITDLDVVQRQSPEQCARV